MLLSNRFYFFKLYFQTCRLDWNTVEKVLSKIQFFKFTFQFSRKHKDKVLIEAEAEILKDICNILRPFSFLTNKLGGQKYSTLSMILPGICMIEEKLEIDRLKDSTYVKLFKSKLKENLDFYSAKYFFLSVLHRHVRKSIKIFVIWRYDLVDNPTLCAATSLYPEYKKNSFLDNEPRRKRELYKSKTKDCFRSSSFTH